MANRRAKLLNWNKLIREVRSLGITQPTVFFEYCRDSPRAIAPGESTIKKIFKDQYEATASDITRMRLERILTCGSLLAESEQLPTHQQGRQSRTNSSANSKPNHLLQAIRLDLSPRERLRQIDTLHQQGHLQAARLMAKSLYRDLKHPLGKAAQPDNKLLGEVLLWIGRTHMSVGRVQQAVFYVSQAIRHFENYHDPQSPRNNLAAQLANAFHTLHASYRIAEEFQTAEGHSRRGLEYVEEVNDEQEQLDLRCWFLEARSTLLNYIDQSKEAYASANKAVKESTGRDSTRFRIRPATLLRGAESMLMIAANAPQYDWKPLIRDAERLIEWAKSFFDPQQEGWAKFLYTRTMFLYHKVRRETTEAQEFLDVFFRQVIAKDTNQIHQRIYVMRAVKDWPEVCPDVVKHYLRTLYPNDTGSIADIAAQEEAKLKRIRTA